MKSQFVYVGVDVSKDSLDVDWLDSGVYRIGNTRNEIRKLAERIAKASVPVVVCCESTGGYERRLCEGLTASGCNVAYVNAARVRHYAKSKGILAKTDRIDAKVITEFAQSAQPRLLEETEAWLPEVKALMVRREELVDMRKAEQSRLDPKPIAEIALHIKQHIRQLERLIRSVEEKLLELRTAHTDLAGKYVRLTAVKSIGEITALSLLAYLPELGRVSGNQAAALAGLAPYNDDSGTKKGVRRIRGGRARIRRVLYMGALSAIRYNPILSAYYQQLKSRGKPSKVALTAVMRKLVLLANRLLADPDFQLT